MALGTDVRHGIVPMASPWIAAAKPGQGQPAASPCAVHIDGFARIVRARGEMAAMGADKARERVAISHDRGEHDGLRHPPPPSGRRVHVDGVLIAEGCAAIACFSSIWAIAFSTASKTSSVDGWRAL